MSLAASDCGSFRHYGLPYVKQSLLFIGRTFEGIGITMGWQAARGKLACGTGLVGNNFIFYHCCLGRDGFVLCVAVMNILCFAFVYVFWSPRSYGGSISWSDIA